MGEAQTPASEKNLPLKTPSFYGSRNLLPDFTTAIGFLAGLGMMGWAMMSGAGGLKVYWDLASFLIVMGGTLAATFISFSTAEVVKVFTVLLNIFGTQLRHPEDLVKAISQLAMVCRRGGNLYLEKEEKKIGDDYLRKCICYVVDGVEEDIISDYMLAEIESKRSRHEIGQRLFKTMGALAPSFGMIGTLIGLVQVLNCLDDPKKIGPAMAVALLTTFYGATLAYLFFLPIAEKLKSRSIQEIFLMQLTYTGIISLRRYESPRVIEKKLNSFLESRKRVITKNI